MSDETHGPQLSGTGGSNVGGGGPGVAALTIAMHNAAARPSTVSPTHAVSRATVQRPILVLIYL